MTNPIFLDRRDVLPGLSKRLDGFRSGYRQNVALLGEEGMGKTAILKQLLRGPLRGSDLIPVYVETGESENLVEWATRFIQALLYAVLESQGCESLPDRWPDLLERCSSTVPRVTAASRKILDLAEAGRSDLAYQQIWDLPHWVSQDLGCRVVLLLDEFHRLRFLPVKEPFRLVGRKIMVQNSVLYLVTSSDPAAARGILREGFALLFGQFETVEVKPLGSAECQKAVRAAWLECRQAPFCESLVVEWGQGRPDLLALLLEGIRKEQDSQPAVGPEGILLDLLERLFLDAESAVRRRFEARLRSLPDHWSRLYCVHLLAVIAGGVRRLPEMAEATGRPLSQVRRFLGALEQSQLVAKDGTLYRVPDRFFQLWLVTAYPALQGIGFTDLSRAKVRFRETLRSRMEQYRVEFQRPLEDRILAWMRAWAGDGIEMDGRRIQLPRWDTVRRERLASGTPVLVGQGKPNRKTKGWAMVLSAEPLSEGTGNQVAVDLMRQYRHERKFLIPLASLDINARLVLQQAKIRVWDLPWVNHLFERYGMTRILVPEGLEPASVSGEALVFPPAETPVVPGSESKGAAG